VYTVEVDSSERNCVAHPKPNDYTIKLNRPLYDVSSLKIASACVPKTQHLINEGNRYLQIRAGGSNISTVVALHEGTWQTETDLASNLTSQLVNFDGFSNNITVGFDSNLSAYRFSGTTAFEFLLSRENSPATVLGLLCVDTPSSAGGIITGGHPNLKGPNSLIVSVSSGADEFSRYVYASDIQSNASMRTFYTGRFLTGHIGIGDTLHTNTNDDPFNYVFHQGPEKTINDLRIRFYYNNGTQLVPYDFRNRNHVLKLEVECVLDKLATSSPADRDVDNLPPPVQLDERSIDNRTGHRRMIIIGMVILLVLGLVAIVRI